MKLEDQLTNLEISQKLESLGVKQDSLYYWCRHRNDKNFYIYSKEYLEGEDVSRWKIEQEISAFTVSELGEMLPTRITNPKTRNMDFVRFHKGDDSKQDVRSGYTVEYHTTFDPPLCRITSDTEANARGKMLIYLLENKLYDI